MKKKTQIGLITVSADWTPTKSEIENMASKFLHPLQEGEVNAEQMGILIDALKKTIERIEKEARPIIAHQLHSRYSKAEDIVIRGCNIELMEAGVKYDYSNCNDSVLEDLKKQDEELQKKIKEREFLLKSIGYGKTLMVVNEETGELMELKSPSRKSTETYRVKFPD